VATPHFAVEYVINPARVICLVVGDLVLAGHGFRTDLRAHAEAARVLGREVVLPVRATSLATALAERGFVPVAVDLSDLLKGGGGPKCCTLEVRP
jgi:N-dimethylarginine dimethylaminohydrolase